MRYVFPGSFDPVTIGHLDLIKRASAVCDELIVAIMVNPSKKGLIPFDERENLLKIACNDIKNVKICLSYGMLSDIIKEMECDAIVRGVRNLSDFEVEKDRAMLNKMLAGKDTILLYSKSEYSHISSSAVREILHFGGDISALVPGGLTERIKRYSNGGK